MMPTIKMATPKNGRDKTKSIGPKNILPTTRPANPTDDKTATPAILDCMCKYNFYLKGFYQN
jgi:hypothetical protein